MQFNVGQIWREAKKQLEKADIKTASLDAKILTEFAFDFSGLDLVLKEKEKANKKQTEKLNQYISRRINGEPVAKIIGKKEFYSLDFILNEATLVPRPESELLTDLALEHLKKNPVLQILELGVGSGCIIISILKNALKAKAIGIDLSEQALSIAKKNAVLNGVENQVNFIQGSWFEPLKNNEKFDIIISNPPYIKSKEI
ncbi:MAG: peptide chain release factor N(5)-glutamine methyltransferase, partial [Devosiaceae bacterium]|nr:peptide chain release factor N(5)-glutamine methyltransferase [Devosiaceae bacterium]